MFTIIIFILVLSVLVFAHELGHFWTARRFGVRAEEFGFGYPPRIFGVYKDHNNKWRKVIGNKEVGDAKETVYSINWIPVGGFVKIKGEDGPQVFEDRTLQQTQGKQEIPEQAQTECQNDNDSLICKPIWQRTIIMSAGVTMNVILAMVLISIGLMIGLPQSLDGLSSKAQVSNVRIQVAEVLSGSPAKEAGIQIGDIVLGVDGQAFTKDADLSAFTTTKEGQELNYKILRGNDELEMKITPKKLETGEAGIGIAIVTTGLVKYPWYFAIYKGITITLRMVWYIILAFLGLIWGLVSGAGLTADVSGPVGIANMTGQYARMGFTYLMQFTALLSINLAVINFLPFPALDGGHVLFLIIEKIKGSPVRRELAQTIHGIGFALLMILVLVITVREIIGLF